eukprot:Gb_19371 [translate_table: standard]
MITNKPMRGRGWCSTCPQGGVTFFSRTLCKSKTKPKTKPNSAKLLEYRPSASCTLQTSRLLPPTRPSFGISYRSPRPRNPQRDGFEPIWRRKTATSKSSDELQGSNSTSVPFLDFGGQQRGLSSGWLSRMAKNYGSHLMLLLGVGYWVQGFRCFPWLAVNFFLKDNLRVDLGTLQFLQSTVNLPMVAKPIYGIISDAVYIGGAHRVPYIVIGGLLQAISWGSVALIPAAGSSVLVMAAFLLLSNLGASIVEVANDALVAECGKKDKANSSGELQSFVWMTCAAGGILGNLFGGIVVSQVDARFMFIAFFILLSIQVGTSSSVNESAFGLNSVRQIMGAEHLRLITRKTQGSSSFDKSGAIVSVDGAIIPEWKESAVMRSIKIQISDLVGVVKKPEIAYPLSWFAVSYAIIPILTGSMFFYHTQHLKIDPSILGFAKVIGQMGLLVGSIIYNRFLKKVPLRKLLCSVQILLSVCMLSDIFLVKQLNIQLGIPNEVYILGASAFVEAIAQFKILPFTVLLAQLCPAGCEGSLMAFFMSVQCLASIVSGYLGVALASFLGVSSDNYSGLPLGIFIQSMATLVPLIWISFIPDAKPTIDRWHLQRAEPHGYGLVLLDVIHPLIRVQDSAAYRAYVISCKLRWVPWGH